MADMAIDRSGTPVAERRVSSKAFLGHYAAAVAIGVVLVVILSIIPGTVVFTPAGILPVLAVWGYAYLARISSTYSLYADRLEIESGLVGRKIENVDLFRVRDVGLRQGLVGRIGNFGDVYIHSTDSSTPDVHVRAIDSPREFYQQLRQLVSESRARSRTMIVEESHVLPEP